MEGDSLGCLRVRLVGIIVVYNPQDRLVSKDPWSSICRRCDTEKFPPQIQRLLQGGGTGQSISFGWAGARRRLAGLDYPDNYGSRWTAFPLGWGRMRTAKGPDDFGIGFMGSWGIF